MGNNLKFVCGDLSPETIENNDFLLIYDKKWNDDRVHSWFSMSALPSITGGTIMDLGRIWIGSPSPTGNALYYYNTKDPEVNPFDSLTNTMGYNTSFERIPQTFQLLIVEESTAKKLFVLLSPEQRHNLIVSLNICLDESSYEKGINNDIFPWGFVKQFKSFEQHERITPIRKYLLSEINYKDLPVIHHL